MKILLGLVVIVVALIVSTFAYLKWAPQLGSRPDGNALVRMQSSPNYHNGKFRNTPVIDMSMGTIDGLGVVWEGLTTDRPITPEQRLPSSQLSAIDNEQEPYLTWFGHSTLLYEVAGKRMLIDPMLGPNASPFSFGVARYNYTLPATAEDLPFVDYVIITHDHYDHLDYDTIKTILPKVGQFLVPLGVGSHLQRWGVPTTKILEFDWEDNLSKEDVSITAVQSQHFSGRTLGDQQNTLWAAWIIDASDTRVFFGGDSGYFAGFSDLGERHGPFDLVMLDSGQYNALWPSVHMRPAQAVQAHQQLNGRVFMPIHWAGFTLALHDWMEPVEHALQAANDTGVNMITPRIGQRFHVRNERPNELWWRGVK